MRLGPRFPLHGACCSWHTNCKLFLWRWWEMSEVRMDRISLNLPHVTWYFCDGSEFTTATWGQVFPKVTEGWHHLKLLPAHCDLCHWSAIYWSGLSPAPFKPKAVIRLQRARDTTAFLVNQTATNTTENGSLCRCPWDTRHRGLCRWGIFYQNDISISIFEQLDKPGHFHRLWSHWEEIK